LVTLMSMWPDTAPICPYKGLAILRQFGFCEFAWSLGRR
jgi:hypothetical protein